MTIENKIAIRETFTPAITEGEAYQVQMELLVIAKVIGIRKEPTVGELDIILAFIREKYPEFGLNEIREAFKNFAAQEYSEPDGSVLNHYGTFDIVMIGKVFSAHRRACIEATRAKERTAETQRKAEEEENLKILYRSPEYWRRCYKDLLLIIRGGGKPLAERELPPAYDWLSVYKHLLTAGRMEYNETEKEIIRANVMQELTAEREKVTALSGIKLQITPELLDYECKKYAIKLYLKKII